MVTTLGVAEGLVALGLEVFPLKVWSKHPATPHGFKDATSNLDTIRRWWTKMPDANIGVRCGMYPNGKCLVIVDLDEHAPGVSGTEAWDDLVLHQPIIDTVQVTTPSGGRHLYFWAPVQIGNGAGANMPPGIDIRGEGGYAVAPPSTLATDGVYTWELSSDPFDGAVIIDMPKWLVDKLTAVPPTQKARTRTEKYDGNPRPGDLWAAATPWPSILEPDGATYLGTRPGGYELWARPGCVADYGELHTGATLYYGGSDVLKVHTSAWPKLDEGQTYTKLGYIAATRFAGDHSAAARWCAEQGYRPPNDEWDFMGTAPEHDRAGSAAPTDPFFVDWPTFWGADYSTQEWAVYPLIPKGRAVALYAPAKAGKSTIVLAAVAAAATGRPVFGGAAAPPVHILYLDYEMTEADLQERLGELGYGPGDDLSHLHYALLPRIPDLDTERGEQAICTIAKACRAEVVIIDTIGRAVSGDENDSKTIQAFYRLTGKALKSMGIAWLRTDHSGKDVDRGQRGSSAKNDDVDVVWKLSRSDDGIKLERTHSRVSWVPESIQLVRHETDDGDVTYRQESGGAAWPHGTKAAAAEMDRLGLPVDISMRKAQEAMRAAGSKVRNEVIRAAVRYRKMGGAHLGAHPFSETEGTPSGHAGRTSPDWLDDLGKRNGAHLGAQRGTLTESMGGCPRISDTGTPQTVPRSGDQNNAEPHDPFDSLGDEWK